MSASDLFSGWCEFIQDGGPPDHMSLAFTTDDGLVDAWLEMRWVDRRWFILLRDYNTCAYCGEYGDHVDHIYPRSAGGGDEWWNLITACQGCNLRKSWKVPAWADEYQREQSRRIAAFEEWLNDDLLVA